MRGGRGSFGRDILFGLTSHRVPWGLIGQRGVGGDLLRAKGVRPYDKRMLISARTGRVALAHRRVEWGAGGGPGQFCSLHEGGTVPMR